MVAVRHPAGIPDVRRIGRAALLPLRFPSGPLARDCSRLVACATVPDVLIATDADWIFDEVDAALSDGERRVVRVRQGRDVSAAARQIEPELIVLDMQIGNMGGIATALNLEQEFEDGSTPEAPILLLLDRPADVPLARRWGVDGWLVKPLDSLRLRRAARALIAGETYDEPSGLAV
jgi:DNA-binding response OmpR family regulator